MCLGLFPDKANVKATELRNYLQYWTVDSVFLFPAQDDTMKILITDL